VPASRPFQFSLRSLLLAMTLIAPVVAAASGAFGEAIQLIVLTAAVGVGLVVFTMMIWLTTIAIMLLLTWPILWLLEAAIDFCSRRFTGKYPM
jgi:hypothetical protein